MKLLIIGDLHGEFKELDHALRYVKTGHDAIIQLGDFGIWKDVLRKC